MTRRHSWVGLLTAGGLLAACGLNLAAQVEDETPIPSDAPTATWFATAHLTLTLPSSSIPSPSPTLTSAPPPTLTSTPIATATLVPNYVKLRGMVVIERAVCHYGPGAPYLYKYGVVKGSNLEIIRRVIGHNYIEVQAIGGENPCWVRADYMQIRGEGSLENLEPVHGFDVRLPISPYYAPPSGIETRRDGMDVTVTWHLLILRAGDDSEQTPYIVEAWVCRGGQMVFDPVRAWQPSVVIVDEPGCNEPSRARLIAAEKHGYTRPVEIHWPPAEVEQLGGKEKVDEDGITNPQNLGSHRTI